MRMQIEVRLKVLGLSASLLQSCSSAGSRDQACTTSTAVCCVHGICRCSCSSHMLCINCGSRMLEQGLGDGKSTGELRPCEC